MIDDSQLKKLEERAKEMRHTIVNMMGSNKVHHFGGALSCVELVTALYFYKMRLDPKIQIGNTATAL